MSPEHCKAIRGKLRVGGLDEMFFHDYFAANSIEGVPDGYFEHCASKIDGYVEWYRRVTKVSWRAGQ